VRTEGSCVRFAGRRHARVQGDPLQALRIDQVVNSASAAIKPLNELREVNSPYFRPFI
jgi:hypothetical protein